LALILAEIGPGRFNAGHGALVNGFGVSETQLEEHRACDVAAVEDFGLHALEDAPSQGVHLLEELRTEPSVVKVLEGLEVSLLLGRPHHGVAVAVLEEVDDEPPNAILLLYVVRVALLLLEGILKVLFRVDLIPKLVEKLQREVSHHPKKRWEVLSHLIRVGVLGTRLLDLQLLGQVDNKR